MESSSYAHAERLQDRVAGYLTHGIGGMWCLSGFGFFLLQVTITSVDGNFDLVGTVGLVLFSLPPVCLGLLIIITMLCLLLLGIGATARGMRGVSIKEAVTGMIITMQSLILLAAVFDIAFYASDYNVWVVLLMASSGLGVYFFIAISFRIVSAVKIVCLKQWGTILQAKVHQRRRQRHRRKDDNGMESYEHQLLVTFEVKASHQHLPCWRKFGYLPKWVFSPTTEASAVNDEDDLTLTEALLCGESNGDLHCQHQSYILDDGCPLFQPRLVQENTDDNAIPYTQQSIQKWLTVNEYQYESSNNFVEVSALPSWPQISVATDTLPSSCRAAFEAIAYTSTVVVVSVGFVSAVCKGIFENNDILWHVKVSYIYILISFLPTLSLLFLLGNAHLKVWESGSHVTNESGPELSMIMIEQSTRGSVAEEEDELATTHFREADTLTQHI